MQFPWCLCNRNLLFVFQWPWNTILKICYTKKKCFLMLTLLTCICLKFSFHIPTFPRTLHHLDAHCSFTAHCKQQWWVEEAASNPEFLNKRERVDVFLHENKNNLTKKMLIIAEYVRMGLLKLGICRKACVCMCMCWGTEIIYICVNKSANRGIKAAMSDIHVLKK